MTTASLDVAIGVPRQRCVLRRERLDDCAEHGQQLVERPADHRILGGVDDHARLDEGGR